jgi:FO synthase
VRRCRDPRRAPTPASACRRGEIARCSARGDDFDAVCDAADALRREVNGDTVTYVVNRNINYTNVCYFKCQFCAFSKGKLSENLRRQALRPRLDEEIARRAHEAWERGGTEVCMQGGIHPEYTGETYLARLEPVKEALPGMHIHAFSPLEVWQGAETLGIPLRDYLSRELKRGGASARCPAPRPRCSTTKCARSLPDKINTDEWLEVMETAHERRLPHHRDHHVRPRRRPVHWARHLLRIRDLQARTGGFTEFVPLPFVHMEAPIYLKGRARKGPTFREAVLMHAVARLVLHPHITNIQVSWVKMGA